MTEDWYKKIGRNKNSNRKRDFNRSQDGNSNYKGSHVTLESAIAELEILYHKESNPSRKKNYFAVLEAGKFIKENSPLVKTQEVIKIYRKAKELDNNKMYSLTMHEILKNHFPVSHVLVNGVAYTIEEQFQEAVKRILDVKKETFAYDQILIHIRNSIGSHYQQALEYLDTKRDRDVLKGLISKITSIRFATSLENRKSRLGHRQCFHALEGNLMVYQEIKQTSLTVRSDMTTQQQAQLHNRITSQRKIEEMKTIAAGRGASYKCDQFPELAVILEGVFGENGLESHPRLTDEILYKAKSSALTMKRARETLLALSPESFHISLSSCYNYTQNYKVGTAQAKRHHHGKDINACLSLHAPPRIGVENISPNLHWSTANVNNLIEIIDVENGIIDSKDAKCIVCADIAPVQRPGKTWKKRDGVLLDHEWNQSRTNAVTPMTHLIIRPVDDPTTNFKIGKGVTLINLSLFEPSTSFRCMNEFFKMLLQPSLDTFFRNSKTNELKSQIVFVVDNGPAESPSSVLVQLLLIRMRKFLNLDSISQVSFAEYHAKETLLKEYIPKRMKYCPGMCLLAVV